MLILKLSESTVQTPFSPGKGRLHNPQPASLIPLAMRTDHSTGLAGTMIELHARTVLRRKFGNSSPAAKVTKLLSRPPTCLWCPLQTLTAASRQVCCRSIAASTSVSTAVGPVSAHLPLLHVHDHHSLSPSRLPSTAGA